MFSEQQQANCGRTGKHEAEKGEKQQQQQEQSEILIKIESGRDDTSKNAVGRDNTTTNAVGKEAGVYCEFVLQRQLLLAYCNKDQRMIY